MFKVALIAQFRLRTAALERLVLFDLSRTESLISSDSGTQPTKGTTLVEGLTAFFSLIIVILDHDQKPSVVSAPPAHLRTLRRAESRCSRAPETLWRKSWTARTHAPGLTAVTT
jgi:hypothetical protein